MGFLNWLKGAAGSVARGASWLGKNIIKPAASFLQQVPIVGEVVESAKPIGDFIQKTADYGVDVLSNPPNKRQAQAPTMDEFIGAVGAVPKTLASYAGAKAGLVSKMGEFKQRFGQAAAM